jgi:UDP-GlcNAc:undecaprenyl-phosphate/decaprenyl-phosphate GlcNAc-1-phosphate transferase
MPTTYFVTFLVSIVAAAALTLTLRHLALRFGWVDRIASSRKIHSKPIPRLGGIGIVVGFFTPLVSLFVVESFVGSVFRAQTDLVRGLFIGGAVIAALGLYDDLKGAGAPLKFLVQGAVALWLYQLGFRIEVLANPFGEPLDLGLFSLPLTMFWVVGVINAMNLIDGLDGLAGGVAFFCVATNFVLAATRGDILLCLCMAALGGAILGFLIFNFNPASIFMGDTGSMFLGFVLAVTSVKSSAKSGTAVAMLVPIIALGLPIMDTLLAMVRRTLLGRPMFSADKEHIHHRLMSRVNLSHKGAVLVLYGLCCFFALIALGLSFANGPQSAMLLAAVGVIVIVLMRKLGYLSLKQAGALSDVRRKNVELRTVVKEVIDRIRLAETLGEIWESIWPLAAELEASRLELNLGVAASEGFLFATTRAAGSALPFDIRVDVRLGSKTTGYLGLTWRDGRSEVNRDEELAVELVADAVAEASGRIAALANANPRQVVPLRRS